MKIKSSFGFGFPAPGPGGINRPPAPEPRGDSFSATKNESGARTEAASGSRRDQCEERQRGAEPKPNALQNTKQNAAKKRQSGASAQPRPLGCELERLRAEQLRARRRAVDKRVSPLLRFTPPRTPAPSYEFSSLPPAPPHAARSRPRSELKRQTALKPKSDPKPKSKPKRRQGFRPWLGAETYASTNPRKVPWQGSRRRTKG